jgi:hypothetical protein
MVRTLFRTRLTLAWVPAVGCVAPASACWARSRAGHSSSLRLHTHLL